VFSNLICASTFSAALLFAAGDPFYFPPSDGAWERVDPPAAGWDPAKLGAVLDFAESRRSNGVVILLRGRILAQRPAGALPVEDVASVQKSVAATLFGIAKRKGLIKLEDPASKWLGTGWTKLPADQEQRITMRHLISMSSGLSDEFGFEAEPGTKWRYNSPAYQKVMRALAKAAGKSENELTREWLTGPLGMRESVWKDRPGTGGMNELNTTAADLARFGLMILARGEWQGKRIVEDRAYFRQMLDSSQTMNPAYGFLWWLNGKQVVRANGSTAPKLIPAAPDDLVAALGARGRKVHVVPSLGVVATRTGEEADRQGEPPFDQRFWRLLMDAAPVRPVGAGRTSPSGR